MLHANLDVLGSGEVAFVDRITASAGSAKRLADMGFVHGAHLEMVRSGVPCIVRVGGTCVGLGHDHQLSIQLRSR